MAAETCFVIMPIGDQEFGGLKISSSDLKQRYNDLIKEALLAARPNMEIVRADEVPAPGTITTDILTRLMHSTFVIADVTYPNPNVFYELGLRHACRVGTVIIRDKAGPNAPFDISHLRRIEYDNSPSGLKVLSAQLKKSFDHFQLDPSYPDNHFQELAKLMKYVFPNYAPEDKKDPQLQLMMAAIRSPDVLNLLTRKMGGEQVAPAEMARAMISNPEVAENLIKLMLQSGQMPPIFPPK